MRVPSEYAPEGYLITRALIEEGRGHLVMGEPIPLACPVRLLHGMGDPDVPWQTSLGRRPSGWRRRDVRLTLIKDGDHRLSRDERSRASAGDAGRRSSANGAVRKRLIAERAKIGGV